VIHFTEKAGFAKRNEMKQNTTENRKKFRNEIKGQETKRNKRNETKKIGN
jgi:hypothetical protein